MTTRAERLTAYFQDFHRSAPVVDLAYPDAIAEILAIADNREFVSLKGFAEMIGRDRTTILSWKARGQHDIPVRIGRCATFDIWDADDIRRWAEAHPELVR